MSLVEDITVYPRTVKRGGLLYELPTIIRRPSAAAARRFYSPAWIGGVGGEAICQLTSGGRLTGCVVTHAEPHDPAASDAVRRIAQSYVVRSRLARAAIRDVGISLILYDGRQGAAAPAPCIPPFCLMETVQPPPPPPPPPR